MPETKPNQPKPNSSVKPKSKVPLIVGVATGGAGVVAAISMAVVLAVAPKPAASFKLTLNAGEHGTIDGERTKVLDNQTIIQTPYSVKADVDYEFKGWYQDEAKTQAVKYPFSLNQDTTFYADYINYSPTTYTVTYDTDGGKPINDTIVLKGQSVSRPETSKEGYTLYKWHKDSIKGPEVFKLSGTTYETFTPTEKLTHLFVEWKEDTDIPIVTLNGNGGKVIGETSYKVNELQYAPTAIYDQHELLGWYVSTDTTQTPVTFPFKVTENVTLVAKWNRVAFNAGMYHGINHDKAYATWEGIKLLRYADIPTPVEGDIDLTGKTGSAAVISNYEIDKWIDEDDGTTYEPGKVDIAPLGKDTKLYATWKHTKYNVTLHNVGDTKQETLEGLTLNDLKTAPAIPTGWVDEHEASTGWYVSTTATTPIHFPYEGPLNADLNFYLKKEASMGKVYLHVSDKPGSATYNGTEDWYYTEAYASQGSGFNKRGQPEVAYKEALGWARVDSDMGEDGRAPTEADLLPKDQDWVVRPEANRIAHLYPMYRDTHYKVSFITNGGSEISDRMVPANTTMEDIPEPMKGGHTFKHWCTDSTLKTPVDWTAAISKDMIVYADYDEVSWKVIYHFSPTEGGEETTFTTLDYYKKIPDYTTAGGTVEPKDPQGLGRPWLGWTTDPNNRSYPEINLVGKDMTETTDVYAVFPSDATTCVVTVDPNGGKWSDGSTAVKTFKAYKNFDPLANQEEVISLCGETTLTKESLTLNGWESSVDLGQLIPYPYDVFEKVPAESTPRSLWLTANWIDKTKYSVTFNAGDGYFKYYNETSGEIETTKSYVYNVDETKYPGGDPTFSQVYNDFLESLSTTTLTVTGPTYDGYELNVQGSNGTGWLWQGQQIQQTTPMSLIGAATITADYKLKSASNWWTDDWFTVVNEANKGENALKTTYASAYSGTDADGEKGTATKKANTFVGLQKTMTMSDYGVEEFRTRVIGTKEDTVSGSTDKALLTFDFIDCPISADFGKTNNYLADNSFHNSTLRKLLRGALPDGLKNGLLSVAKYAIEPVSSYASVSASLFSSDLFLLSATEVNGNTTQSAKIESAKGGGHFSTYTYYSKDYSGVDPNDIGTSTTYNAYRFKYYNKQLTSWWTRTPAHPDCYFPEGGVSGWNSSAFYISTNEHTSSASKPYQGGIWMWESTGSRGISPGFCIGQVAA